MFPGMEAMFVSINFSLHYCIKHTSFNGISSLWKTCEDIGIILNVLFASYFCYS
jgi:hypothetical protein